MDLDARLSPARLPALPPELIIRIIDFAHPAVHFNFALSCRYMFECSKDVLEAHRKWHDQYAVCSDVLPTTMPDLVRKLLADPTCVDLWHVRTLELYWERQFWCHWEICGISIVKGTRVRGRGSPLGYALTQDEQALFLDVLREWLYFSEKDITSVQQDLESGSDAPLKALVIALCPRLTTVKYSRDYRVSGRQAFDDYYGQGQRNAPRSSIDYVQRVINLHPDDEPWPVGLSSMRYLAIGVRTGTELDQIHSPSPFHLLLDLIKLPRLTSLYFHALSQCTSSDAYDTLGEPYDVSENSSMIEHIFIENSALSDPREFRDALGAAPKALKSLTFSACEANDLDRWL